MKRTFLRSHCLFAFLAVWLGAATAARAQEEGLGLLQQGGEICARGKAERAARLSARGSLEPASRASANFDATYYDLDLDLDFTAEAISGVVRVEGRVVDSPLQTLALDFSNTMSVSSVEDGGGMPLTFSHVGDVLSITLPAAAPVGASVVAVITYSGVPVPVDLGGFEFDLVRRGGGWMGPQIAWSLSEPYAARTWWPCKDHPSDKADSLRVSITVPDTMTAASQGTLVSVIAAGGRTTYEWRSPSPIATYLVSVAASAYVRYDSTYVRSSALASEFGGPLTLPIVHYRYQDDNPSLPSGWAAVVDVLAVQEEWFGPYPFPAEKYGHAEFEFGGGMEHQTLTSLGHPSLGVVVHEAAHQWFGDAVTLRTWPDLWLNEGFATFAELLYWDMRRAQYPGFYEIDLEFIADVARNATGTLVLADTTNVDGMFAFSRVYAKGAMVLHMLRQMAGDTDFRALLRAYATSPAHRYGSANTAEFQALAEAATGTSLGTFFSQWVTEGTGYPAYRVNAYAQGNTLHVTLEQIQAPTASNVDAFVMPVTFAVQTTAGEERFTVLNDARYQTYSFSLAARPTAVAFDPDIDLLRNEFVDVAFGRTPTFPVITALVPNPTSSASDLRFVLPSSSARVQIRLYDVAGRFVRAIDAGTFGSGPQSARIDTQGLVSGVYFLHLQAASGTAKAKLAVVR
ncbi:MAG: M1 family aminopeptidase [Candidatus Krumholzibacteria bacterium]|nr:M1 family aminopeptidase [Candidatus Krumholzibacteria bacterium]